MTGFSHNRHHSVQPDMARDHEKLIELEKIKQQEIEHMMMNKQMTFDDIEKLNYRQINEVSNKFGEDEFDPV